MSEEEYNTRINKINARLSTDRCSDDEATNLNVQRIYLKDKYIDYLQQENTQLKQDVEKLAHNMTVQDIYNAKIVQQLKDKDEKISKVIILLKNPSTIDYEMYGLEYSTDVVNIKLLLEILESNKED